MTEPSPQPEANEPAAETNAAPGGTDSAESGAEAAADSSDEEPQKKRKRRRRRRKKKPEGAEGQTSPAPASATEASPASDVAASMANLAGGLLSHVDDREIPCRVDGCKKTWIWTADEQIRNFGQPPPRRMCRDCQRDETEAADREVRCKIEGCKRSWTWTRDAQIKHRTWVRRHGAEAEAAPPPGKGKRRRRRRGRPAGVNDPPPRMCEPCRAKSARLVERESPCKVHGCTRMAKVDRESVLRAWAQLHTDDLDVEGPLPRRMCEVCRQFCRHHPDREVVCGRPGCDKTWTYKTGAQLQAFLAGRLEDPVRLCAECSKADFATLLRPAEAPPGAEVMPCVITGCEGVWYWLPGTALAPANPGDLPLDRMCSEHRQQHVAKASDKPTDESTDAPVDAPAPESTEASTETTTEASTEAAAVDAAPEPDRPVEASAESPAE